MLNQEFINIIEANIKILETSNGYVSGVHNGELVTVDNKPQILMLKGILDVYYSLHREAANTSGAV